jgi:hypothetical protein
MWNHKSMYRNTITDIGGFRRFLPQILSKADTKFIAAYAEYLYDVPEYAKEDDSIAMKSVITQLLTILLLKIDLFALTCPSSTHYYSQTSKSPETAKSFLKLCIDCDNVEVASRAIERLVSAQALPEDVGVSRASTVLMPVLTFLSGQMAKMNPKPNLPLRLLGKVSIEQSLKGLTRGKFKTKSVTKMIDTAIEAGDPGLVDSLQV